MPVQRRPDPAEVQDARDRMARNLIEAGNPPEKAWEIARAAVQRFGDDRRKADKE